MVFFRFPTSVCNRGNPPSDGQTCLKTPLFRKTQEGCGGHRGENPGAFPKAGPIFQQPFSLPENAQTLAGTAFRAAGKSVRNFLAALKFAGKLFQQGISDSHSLLEFSEQFFRHFGAVCPCRCWRRSEPATLKNTVYPGEKRHMNINFLLWLTSRWPWDKRLVVPGLTGPKSLCVRFETQEI